MKRHFKTYLLIGLLGGSAIFLLEIYDLYFATNFWFYVLFFLMSVAAPMVLKRFKNKNSNSFSGLFSSGLSVGIITILSFTIFSQVLPNLIYGKEERVRLVDEKVNRLIMDFDGNKIDIFKLEESAESFFESSLSTALLPLLYIIPLTILLATFFALIFKKEA